MGHGALDTIKTPRVSKVDEVMLSERRYRDAAAPEAVRVSSNVVIVSPYFPPSSLAGVHRARHLAKHLPSFGWHPIVV